MVRTGVVVVVVLLLHCAWGQETVKKKYSEMTEEEMQKAEELKGVARCAACEEMVVVVEKEMVKIPKNTRSNLREVRAIDIIESACQDAESRLYCDEAVEKLEDDLIAYIKKGTVVAKFNETVCVPCCGWKTDLKNSISDMNTNFIEKAKKQELEKQIKELEKKREELRVRRENMTYAERFSDAWALVMQDLEGWWLIIFASSFALAFLLSFLQILLSR
eukprot:gene22083-33864_t